MAEKSQKPLLDSSEDGSTEAVGLPGQRKAVVGKTKDESPKSVKGVAKPTKKG